MSRKLFVGLLFGILFFFATASENFAQKTTKTPKKAQMSPSKNNDWFNTFAKAIDYAADHPEAIVVIINRAKASKDAPVAKLEKNVMTALNEMKLDVPVKIFSGNSDTAATYYGLLYSTDSDDNSYAEINDDFKKKAKELADKIKAAVQ